MIFLRSRGRCRTRVLCNSQDVNTMHTMSDYLLVHGGFGGGWVWDDVVERLEMAGHRVRVVDQLPSAGGAPGDKTD